MFKKRKISLFVENYINMLYPYAKKFLSHYIYNNNANINCKSIEQ